MLLSEAKKLKSPTQSYILEKRNTYGFTNINQNESDNDEWP